MFKTSARRTTFNVDALRALGNSSDCSTVVETPNPNAHTASFGEMTHKTQGGKLKCPTGIKTSSSDRHFKHRPKMSATKYSTSSSERGESVFWSHSAWNREKYLGVHFCSWNFSLVSSLAENKCIFSRFYDFRGSRFRPTPFPAVSHRPNGLEWWWKFKTLTWTCMRRTHWRFEGTERATGVAADTKNKVRICGTPRKQSIRIHILTSTPPHSQHTSPRIHTGINLTVKMDKNSLSEHNCGTFWKFFFWGYGAFYESAWCKSGVWVLEHGEELGTDGECECVRGTGGATNVPHRHDDIYKFIHCDLQRMRYFSRSQWDLFVQYVTN